MKYLIALLLLTVGMVVWFNSRLVTRTQVLMGTYASVTLPAKDEDLATSVFAEILRIENILSTYKADSEVSRLNRTGRLDGPSATLIEVLKRSKDLYRLTDGYFNVAIGAVTEGHYGFHRLADQDPRRLTIPTRDLRPALATVDLSTVHLGLESIVINPKGAHLDFGGIGKGYAVDQAAKLLKGVKRGQVALGGDIHCLDRCEVTIAPDKKIHFRTRYPGMAISTSGVAYRYIGKTTVNHLINPKNGLPQRQAASLTTLGRVSNTDLDALTTAAAVMPFDRAVSLLKKQHVAFIWIKPNGQTLFSDNFHELAERLD